MTKMGLKCLVSNDCDLIIKEINDYMIDVRINKMQILLPKAKMKTSIK